MSFIDGETRLRISNNDTSLLYVLRLAGPMIVTYLSFTVMQFVDRLMVSRLGTNELAAILPAGIISFVPASFALGIIKTLNTFVSQSLGRDEKEQCSNYCWQTLYLGFAYFVLVTSIFWPLAPMIFGLLKHEPAVLELEVTYLRIMLYVHFVAMVAWSCNHFFMGIHRTKAMMVAAMIGHVVNVAANWLLIFGHLGFPAMGIAGAAWGTFCGFAVEAIIMISLFLTGFVNRNFQSRKSFNLDYSKMFNLIRIGSPNGVSFMINVTFFGLILMILISQFGKEALAATTAVWACINLAMMPIVGISNALTAVVGKSLGAGEKFKAVIQTRKCLIAAGIYIILMALIFVAFRRSMMHLWSSDRDVIETGLNIFILAALFQVFNTVNIIHNGSLRGAGDTMWLAMLSMGSALFILGGCGFLIVWVFPQLGAVGPWIAAVTNIIVMALANIWRFRSGRWAKIDIFRGKPAMATIDLPPPVE